MGQRKLRPRSSVDERAAAVASYRASGKSARLVAADLGVSKGTLESWIRDANRAEADPAGTLSPGQLQSLLELQRENARLQREVDFLKKADAFFRDIDRGETSSL